MPACGCAAGSAGGRVWVAAPAGTRTRQRAGSRGRAAGSRNGAARAIVASWRRRGRGTWPLAHLGVAVMLAGVAGTTTGTQVSVSMAPGNEIRMRGYTLRLVDVAPVPVPHGSRAAEARLVLGRGGRSLATLRPESLVSATGQRVSVAALRSTPLTDVQVALRAAAEGGEAVVVDVGVHPLMQLVWWGGLLVVAGLSLGVVRPRRRQQPPAAAPAVPVPEPVEELVRPGV